MTLKVLKNQLRSEFEMKDLREARKILGMDIKRDKKRGTLCVSQKGYIEKILKKLNLQNSNLSLFL